VDVSESSSPILLGLAHAAGWFAAFVMGHIAAFRARPARARASVIVRVWAGAVLGFLGSVVVCFAVIDPVDRTAADAIVALLTGLAGLSTLFILYVPFYYTVAASLSIQTLIAIQDAGGNGMPAESVHSQQFLDRLLDGRIGSLIEGGNLVRTDAGFQLTARGRRIALFFQKVKAVWRLGPGG
jgi:hypothetical protein